MTMRPDDLTPRSPPEGFHAGSPRPRAASTSAWRAWRIPAALIVLTLVPMVGGALRLAELTDGAAVTPMNARFIAAPTPVVLHIVSAIVYCLLGAFQFAPDLRRRRPDWHRAAGRWLIPCGLVAALSALWMSVFYPDAPGDGALLRGIRLVAGTGMLLSLVLGFTAIRRCDVARHREWMIRAYAIGQGAGTQVLTGLFWALFAGVPGATARALVLMGGGWAINLLIAERSIRRPPGRPSPSAPLA